MRNIFTKQHLIIVLAILIMANAPLAHATYTPFNTSVAGNIGIGSASPGQKLDVKGTVRATAFIGNGAGLTGVAGTNYWLNTAGTGNVGISTTNTVGIGTTSGVGAGLVVMNGNVGIGTWVPTSSLMVNSNNLITSIGNFNTVDSTNVGLSLIYDPGNGNNFQGEELIAVDSGDPAIEVASYDGTVANPGTRLAFGILGARHATGGAFFQSTAGAPFSFEQGGGGQGNVDALAIGINIGAVNPTNMLDVNGGVAIGPDYAGIEGDPDGQGAIIEGNVGIGQVAPGGHGSGASGPFLDVYSAGGNAEMYFGTGISTAVNTYSGTFGGYVNSASGENRISLMDFVTDADSASVPFGRIEFQTNNGGVPAVRMVIKSGGNVGIASTAPGQVLDVQGTVRATNFVGNGSALTGITGTNYWLNTAGTGNVGISTTNTVGIGTTSGVGAGLVVMNGNVGIGTWVPATTLSVNGTATLSNAIVGNNTLDSATAMISDSNRTLFGISQSAVLKLLGTTAGVQNLIFADNNSTAGRSGIILSNSSEGNGWQNDFFQFLVHGPSYVGNAFLTALPGKTSDAEWVIGGAQSNDSTMLGFGFGTIETIPFVLMTNNTAAIYIDSSQNVGIGTSFTNSRLSVMSGNVGIGTWNTSALFEVARQKFDVTSSGNVGIGSISPGQALDVQGTVRATNFVGNGSGLTGIGAGTNYWLNTAGVGNVGISTSNTVGIGTTSGVGAGLVVMNGNVGIGTWKPVNILDVSGGSVIGSGWAGSVTAPSDGLFVKGNVGIGTNTIQGSTTVMQVRNTDGTDFTFQRHQDVTGAMAFSAVNDANTVNIPLELRASFIDIPISNLGIQIAGTPLNALEVNGAGEIGYNNANTAPSNGLLVKGNVGVGSVAPGQALDVTGTVRATAFIGNGAGLTGISAGTNYWLNTAGTGNVGISTTNTVGIGTTSGVGAGLVVMNGNVGIGTWKPVNTIDVSGTMSVGSYRGIDTAPANSLIVSGNLGVGTFAPSYLLAVNNNATNNMYFDTNGQLQLRRDGPGMSNDTSNSHPALNMVDAAGYGIGFWNFFTYGTPFGTQTVPTGTLRMSDTGAYSGELAVFLAPSSGSPDPAQVDVADFFGDHVEFNVPIFSANGTSTLDDGSGNTTIGVNLFAGGSLATPRNTLDDGGGNAFIGGVLSTTNNTLDDGSGGMDISGSFIGNTNNSGPTFTWNSSGGPADFVINANNNTVKSQNNILDNGSGGATFIGNVGIGSTAPGQILDVKGTVRATNFVGNGSGLTGIAGASNYWLNTAGTGNVGISTTNTVGIGTTSGIGAGLVVMNGNVGIGTWVPGSNLQITGSGLNSANESAFLKVQGTLPAADTSQKEGFFLDTTSAGSSNFVQSSMRVVTEAGYTGGNQTRGAIFENYAASTGTDPFGGGNANYGFYAYDAGVTTGTNVAALAQVNSSSGTNIAVLGRANESTNSPTTNIGMVGIALNGSSTNIGGYFGLRNTVPTFTSSALLIDNGSVAAPIFIARNNGTEKFRIDNGGNVGIGSAFPGQVLDVTGTVRATAFIGNGAGLTGIAGASNYWLNTAGTGNVGISTTNTVGIGTTSGVGAGLVVMNGNVGIGTWVPGSALQVNNTFSFQSEYNNGNSGTSLTVNWNNGNKQKVTLTGNCTFTFTAPSGVSNLLLKVVQDGTGSRTASWPAAVKWPGGTAPTLTTTASQEDVVTCYWDGSDYLCSSTLNFTP